ncbi:MAG: hypothetical protein ACP5JW_07605 [Candidatus Bathyarchaeia archaeon]
MSAEDEEKARRRAIRFTWKSFLLKKPVSMLLYIWLEQALYEEGSNEFHVK